MSENNSTNLNDVPSMPEKVKFWEEQDKINQALIPRVVEMRERLEDLSRELSKINGRISNTEARILQKKDERQKERFEKLNGRVESICGRIDDLEQWRKKSADDVSLGQLERVAIVSWAALGVAVVTALAAVILLFS